MDNLTPEPWEIEYDNDGNGGYSAWYTVGPARVYISVHDADGLEKAYADAYFISLAPVMYDALQKARVVLEKLEALEEQLNGNQR